MTALFVSHGAPPAALDEDDWSRALAAWGRRHPKPRAALVLSAHWEAPLSVTVSPAPATLHDYEGFSEELLRIRYPAPGDRALAEEVARRLGALRDPRRGLDHGAWGPLRKIYPEADVPVVQLSLPPSGDVAPLGRALADLRREGVLLVGSGGAVHNLRSLTWHDKAAPTVSWARDFDRWFAERAGDAEALAAGLSHPEAARAHPTSEHLLPAVFVSAAALPGDRVESVYEGFQYGSLSMRCFARVSA